ncbi:MAG TPA: cell division protein FtsA [Chloroflexi bacterium]|nr:cell division protein FtsA [Chloroflexota bacterium]
MEEPILVGIDVGTTKVCTLVARPEADGRMRILGVGLEPSRGLNKGMVVDMTEASRAIARSVEKASRAAGMEIAAALVSLAGSHVSGEISRGVVGVSGGVVDAGDIQRAVEAARALAVPHDREIVHIIQRAFRLDDQESVREPLGMHGYRLEAEVHIITASKASVANLRECVQQAGVEVSHFVLNPLASAEAVLTETEREMGVAVCDIGGGTTDLAVYIGGDVWHTAVLPVGGNHVTRDLGYLFHLPLERAEEIKVRHGHSDPQAVSAEEVITVRSFADHEAVQVNRREMAEVIEARVREMLEMVRHELHRSGYDGLLPAGVVFTGGSTLLKGFEAVAREELGLPVRVAKAEKVFGMVDRIRSPAFATSVGLLYWAQLLQTAAFVPEAPRRRDGVDSWEKVKAFLRSLLP